MTNLPPTTDDLVSSLYLAAPFAAERVAHLSATDNAVRIGNRMVGIGAEDDDSGFAYWCEYTQEPGTDGSGEWVCTGDTRIIEPGTPITAAVAAMLVAF